MQKEGNNKLNNMRCKNYKKCKCCNTTNGCSLNLKDYLHFLMQWGQMTICILVKPGFVYELLLETMFGNNPKDNVKKLNWTTKNFKTKK